MITSMEAQMMSMHGLHVDFNDPNSAAQVDDAFCEVAGMNTISIHLFCISIVLTIW